MAKAWWLLVAAVAGVALTAGARPRQHPIRGRLRQPPPPPPIIHWHGGPANRPTWYGWVLHTNPWGGGSAFVSPAGGIIRFGSGQSFIPEARPDIERPAKPRRTVQIPIAIRPLQPRKAQPQESDKPERVWVKGHWRYTRDRDGNIISRTWVTGHWQDEKPAVRDTP